MGTTADKLQHLINGKQSVVNSVNAKASTNLTITSPWSTISQAIQGITTTVTTEEKTFTPTESIQTYTPTSGTYISKVTVNAIQTETKSVTPTTSSQTVTPTSGKYLKSVSVGAISTQTKTATPSTSSQTIKPDSGKYLSQVTVNAIQTETKTATPSASTQSITPTSGKYLTKVTVNAIPNTYKNTSDATAMAGDLLSGKTAYNSSGKITGTITSYDGSYEGNAGSGGDTGGTSSEPFYLTLMAPSSGGGGPSPWSTRAVTKPLDNYTILIANPIYQNGTLTFPEYGTGYFEIATSASELETGVTLELPMGTPIIIAVYNNGTGLEVTLSSSMGSASLVSSYICSAYFEDTYDAYILVPCNEYYTSDTLTLSI